MVYISMLRGINVSGQKKILMPELKAMYERLGFKHVITYIQSGNVVFSSTRKIADATLAGKIEKAILDTFGFDVTVVIRTLEEMKQVVRSNPFSKRKGMEEKRLYVTFLAVEADKERQKTLEQISYPPDEFIIKLKEIYVYCPVSYGETKLSNSFFESKLKLRATTRNWNTVNKLIELAEAIA